MKTCFDLSETWTFKDFKCWTVQKIFEACAEATVQLRKTFSYYKKLFRKSQASNTEWETTDTVSKSLFQFEKDKRRYLTIIIKPFTKSATGFIFGKFTNIHYVVSLIDEFLHKYISSISLVFMGHSFSCFIIGCSQNCVKTVVSSLRGRKFS